MAYEKWDSEATRYELKEIVTGIFVYVLKPDHARTEPIHWLCPNCFQQRQKSILNKPHVDHLNYHCRRCDLDIVPVVPTRGATLSRSGLPISAKNIPAGPQFNIQYIHVF